MRLTIQMRQELESSRAEHILKNLVPRMIRLALELPKKICAPIGIMREGVSHTISLSQEQCACILANAFFCTFPERYENVDAGARLPFINFNKSASTLFSYRFFFFFFFLKLYFDVYCSDCSADLKATTVSSRSKSSSAFFTTLSA